MNKRLPFPLGFLLLILAGGEAHAQSTKKVRDSLAAIYPSVQSAGNRLIVDAGSLKALFSTAGKVLQPFLFTELKMGLGSDFIAQKDSRWLLLDSGGAEKATFHTTSQYTASIEPDFPRNEYRNIPNRGDYNNGFTRFNARAETISSSNHYDTKSPPKLYAWRLPDNGLWGVKDTFGNAIVPPRYNAIWSLSDWGVAAQKEDSAFIFNAAGNLLFKCLAEEAKLVYDGTVAVKLLGLWALKDTTGKRLTDYYLPDNNNYSGVAYPPSVNAPTEALEDSAFTEAYRSVDWERKEVIGNRFMQLFEQYNDKIPKIYDRKTGTFATVLIEKALPNEAYVIYDEKTRERKILKEDKVLTLPRFTKIEKDERTPVPFFKISNEGDKGKTFLEPDRERQRDRGMWEIEEVVFYPQGLLDTHFQVVVPVAMHTLTVLSHNLISAYREKDSTTTFYSGTGRVLHTFSGMLNASRFPQFVQISVKGEVALMDTNGNLFYRGPEAPELLYTNALQDRQDGLPDLLLYDDASGYSGLYNLEGKQLLPHQYYQVAQKVPGLFSLKKGDSVYFANTKGKLLYGGRGFAGKAYYVLAGYGIVLQNAARKWGVLGTDGSAVLPFEWDSLTAEYALGKAGSWSLLNNAGQLRYSPQSWKPLKNEGPDTYLGSDSGYYQIENDAVQKTTAAAIWLKTYKKYNPGSFPHFHNVYAGSGLPPGIYNSTMQWLSKGRQPYHFDAYAPLLFLTDSGSKTILAVNTTGATVIPPQPVPVGVVENGTTVLLLYANGKDRFFQQQNGVYKEELIQVDSLYRKRFIQETGGRQVARYRAFSFTGANGQKGAVSRMGTFLRFPAGTVFYPDDYAWRVKAGRTWGLLSPDSFRYLHPLEADSISVEYGTRSFTIFQSGTQGLYNGSTQLYFPPEHRRILNPGTLTNGFLVVQDAAGYAILNKQGKRVSPYLDSLSGYSYSLQHAAGYKGGEPVSLKVTDSGTIHLLSGPKARIHRDGLGGLGNTVIIMEGAKQGLWSNSSFEMVLPATWDVIEKTREGGVYKAFKYKRDKYQGLDSTLVLNAAGARLFSWAGSQSAVYKEGYWYMGGERKSPVYAADGKLLIPEGYWVSAYKEKGFFVVAKGALEGIIRTNGTWLIPMVWNSIQSEKDTNDRLYFVGETETDADDEKSLYGLISSSGQTLTKTIYEEIRFTNSGILFKRKRIRGYLTAEGKEIRKAWPADELEED